MTTTKSDQIQNRGSGYFSSINSNILWLTEHGLQGVGGVDVTDQ